MAGKLSRRSFLAGAAVAAAGPLILPGRVLGKDGQTAPSERIGVGFIGNGAMNSYHAREFASRSDCQVTAVCDVNRLKREDFKQKLEEAYAAQAGQPGYEGVKAYNDFRELLADPNVDAVFVATPEHWHTLPALAAVRAGKDVYLEKPMTLTIEEGRVLADEVKRTGRVFQHGAMQRSRYEFGRAVELARNGYLGNLQRTEVALAHCEGGPEACDEAPVPEHLDYEMWLGPAQWRPYCTNICEGVRAWSYIWDYSGGRITEWGTHHLDIAQWGLNADDSGPLEIEGEGEFFPEDSIRNTATHWRLEMLYPGEQKVIFADDTKLGNNYEGGVKFVGDEGWIYVTREFIEAEPKSLLDIKLKPEDDHVWTARDHHQNFVDCIRSREETICPAEASHRSSSACHLANICLRLGRKVRWNPEAERFVDDAEADAMIARPMRAPWDLHHPEKWENG